MANADKIFKRLVKEYNHVKTFNSKRSGEPVWFVCNDNATTFRVVSIYLNSEIGGVFSLDEGNEWMKYVHENFDVHQAYDLRETIIAEIEAGDAVILGDLKSRTLH